MQEGAVVAYPLREAGAEELESQNARSCALSAEARNPLAELDIEEKPPVAPPPRPPEQEE